jgi:hypothetical protein
MAVTYVAQTVITGGAASSKNIARPSGATTGDLLVANVVVFPASATLTAPSTGSWMTLIAKTTVGSEFAFAIFARWDDGSSGPWAVDTTGATSWADGECVAYRGLIGSGTVLDGTPSVSLDTFGFSTAALATAVTTTRANDLVLFYVLMGSTRSQSGTPSGYTDRLVPGTAANYLGDKVQASIATTGDATLNMASGTTNAAILMPLLTQAVAGGVPSYTSGVGITPTSAGVGTLLTVDNGVWTNTPTSFSYQWKRNTTNIGTNAATYTTVTADNGQPITCVERRDRPHELGAPDDHRDAGERRDDHRSYRDMAEHPNELRLRVPVAARPDDDNAVQLGVPDDPGDRGHDVERRDGPDVRDGPQRRFAVDHLPCLRVERRRLGRC